MRFVIFTHSLVSDWNHGNAHFLRGYATELVTRGHEALILEPCNGWSLNNLVAEHGTGPIAEFEKRYPEIRSSFYDPETFDPGSVLDGADAAIVHEWNPPELVSRVGEYRAAHPSLTLFFHDTHHRSATDPKSMASYDLRHYDGVLAYGNAIRDIYRENQWARNVWTWHEAADTRLFQPRAAQRKEGDLVWIGNWGDGERTEEIREFLIEPVRNLGLKARVYGVRYPPEAIEELQAAGIEYGGWLPNYLAPEVFSRYRATIHIPRRPYTRALPGIPTIRPFEALACGIPLISAPWDDCEQLFRPGMDFLFARDSDEMTSSIESVLFDLNLARNLIASGLATIRARHTCAHRVEALFSIMEAAGTLSMTGGAH